MSSSEKAVFARNTSDNSKAGVNVDQLEEQSIGSANTTTQLLDTTLSKIGESQNGTTSDDEISARVYKRVKWDSSHKSAKKETSDRRHELTDGLNCMTVKEENKESHRLHAIKKMAEYVEDKKMEVRSSLESTKALVSGLSSMPSTINQHRDIIELDWLLRKETIRQELYGRKNKALCEECTAVTQIFDNLVEEESSSTFLKEVKDLEERCLCIEQTVQWLTFHELVSPPVLRVPFSLHQEKCHLAEVLSFDNICNTDLVVKSPLVYLPYDLVCWESILASDMWYPARAHPSTDVSYNIEF
ncbi:hypothetical protein ScPMuIL_000726 [Solemya velum]